MAKLLQLAADAPSWDGAACVHYDPELWFCDDQTGEKAQTLTALAKLICHEECPVRDTCLAWATDRGEPFGVWGGKTTDERSGRDRAGRCRRCDTPIPTHASRQVLQHLPAHRAGTARRQEERTVTLTRYETKWGHAYKLDGKAVKGVTTLLNKGLPKPAIAPWAARTIAEYVADNPDQVEQLRTMGRGPMVAALKGVPWQARDEAAIRGTEVHALGERLVHGDEVEVPEHLAAHVEGYVKWLDAWQPQPIWTEKPVASRTWWYAGTFDLIATMCGQTWLLDIKTSSGVYGDTSLQLAAYANAEFLLDDDGKEQSLPPIDRLGVIHVTASGTELYPVADPAAAWKDALHVFWVAKGADRIKEQITDPMHEPQGATT